MINYKYTIQYNKCLRCKLMDIVTSKKRKRTETYNFQRTWIQGPHIKHIKREHGNNVQIIITYISSEI